MSTTPVDARFTPVHRGGSGAPLVCLHGFTDTWRTWELVLPALERGREVLAPTLAGHAGGPEIDGAVTESSLADVVERAMDEAGLDVADIAGNSLGGFLALELAARGRARTVVALAPAGGWPAGDPSFAAAMDHFRNMQELLARAAPHADALVSTPGGRRRASFYIAENFEHIPAELLAHQIVGAAACPAVFELLESAERSGWDLDASRITCPVRIVWGTADRILPYPKAAERFRNEWLPQADYVELNDVGHCPQLDVPAETADLILGFTGR